MDSSFGLTRPGRPGGASRPGVRFGWRWALATREQGLARAAFSAAAVALLVVGSASLAFGQYVGVSRESSGLMSVDAEGAAPSQILAAMGDELGFELEGAVHDDEPIDLKLKTVPLAGVLDRVLENQNHMVIYGRSRPDQSGQRAVERVVLLSAKSKKKGGNNGISPLQGPTATIPRRKKNDAVAPVPPPGKATERAAPPGRGRGSVNTRGAVGRRDTMADRARRLAETTGADPAAIVQALDPVEIGPDGQPKSLEQLAEQLRTQRESGFRP